MEMDLTAVLRRVQEAGQIDALVAGIDPADLAGALIRNGQFFDIMRAASQRAEPGSCSHEGPVGPLWRRPIRLEQPGDTFDLHAHNQPHTLIIRQGKIYVETWDNDFRRFKDAKMLDKFIAGDDAWVPIPNDVWHRFIVIEGPFFGRCTFPLRDGRTGDLINAWDGTQNQYC